MPDVQVDPAGLSSFATECVRQAAVIRTGPGSGPPGPAFQASAVAVTTSDSAVGAAAGTMADRLDGLSADLSSAASRYLDRDGQSAEALSHAVAGSPA